MMLVRQSKCMNNRSSNDEDMLCILVMKGLPKSKRETKLGRLFIMA